MRVAFKHIRDTENLGDRWSSPYDHIPELRERFDASAHDLDAATPTVDAVIFGGGKIMGSLAKKLTPEDRTARHRIAWGVSTVQSLPFSLKYWRSFRAMTLVGSRDWGDDRFAFAPCASCMSPEFDRPQQPEHDVVAYLHHWKSEAAGICVPEGIPVMDNSAGSFADVIRFLASGRTVMSNSYHGIFWTLCLGRRALCIPFSNKFHNYRIAPGYTTRETWRDDLASAKGSDEMLGLCRDASLAFKERVLEHIDS